MENKFNSRTNQAYNNVFEVKITFIGYASYTKHCLTLENKIRTMLPNIINLIVLLVIPCLVVSCTSSQGKSEQKRELTDSSYYNPMSKLTLEQESAFDALTKIQTSTDEMNRLYSTFANIDQPCYPAETSFVVSQSELLYVMQQFIAKHCKNLLPEIQNQLAKSSVLAQKKYKVLHCTGLKSNDTNEKGLPMTGTWVMPNVLDRRDVILVW